jgi:hypothetical protein
LGKNILLVLLCACDTVAPEAGLFPHTSHVLDIEPPEDYCLLLFCR